jgi:hypothetical protein
LVGIDGLRDERAISASRASSVLHRPATSNGDSRRGAEAAGPIYKLTAASRLLVVGEKKSLPPPPPLTVQMQLFLETCRGSASAGACARGSNRRTSSISSGLTSLVDVAGGLGGAAATVAAAFLDLKCTVLDLLQIVAKADPSLAGTNNVYYQRGGS